MLFRMSAVPRDVVPTLVPGLDRILGGGFPRQHSVIITGAPGAGKTILTSQIAFARAREGERVVIATVTSESHDKLVHELREFAFFDHERIGDDVFFLNAFPWVKKGAKETRELLQSTVRERGASLLVFDGVRAIRDVWANEAQLREFLYELNVGLLAHGCLGIFTAEYALDDLIKLPEATTLDGIIALSLVRDGQRRRRMIEVSKLRGRPHLLGEHTMHIDKRGARAVPRFEAGMPETADFQPAHGRAAFGLPELDALLSGGLPRHSSTMLAGSTGVGKTLSALHFAAAGARDNEKVLYVSFHEAPSVLCGRASNVGLDIRGLVESGALTLRFVAPGEIDIDEILTECLRTISEQRVSRFVLDGVSEIEQGIPPDRLGRFMSALTFKLRGAGTTSVFVKEIPKVVGVDVDFSGTPLAITAENVMLFRHVELEGKVRRLLSVLKMRESGYDDSVREFEITPTGVRVLAPIRAPGALTGIPRQ